MKYILLTIILFLSTPHISCQSYSKDTFVDKTAQAILYKNLAETRSEKKRLLMLLTSEDDISRDEAKLYKDHSYVFFDINKEAVDYNIKGVSRLTITGNLDNYIFFCPRSATIIPISEHEWVVVLEKNKKIEKFFKERSDNFFLKKNDEINMSFSEGNGELQKFFKEDLANLLAKKDTKLKNIFLGKKITLEALFLKNEKELDTFLSNEVEDLQKTFPSETKELERFLDTEKKEVETFFSNERTRLAIFYPKGTEGLEIFLSKEEERLKILFFKEKARLEKFFPEEKEELTVFYPAQITAVKDADGLPYKAYYIHLASYDEVLHFVKRQLQ